MINDPTLALIFLGGLLLLAKLAEELFIRLKLVPYVGAVLAGIIVGPGVFNLIHILPNITLFISIGINFLLFVAGAIEFKHVDIGKIVKTKPILIGIIEFIIPFLVISYIGVLLLHNIVASLVIGIVLGMTSCGPLTALLSNTGMTGTHDGTKIFEQAVVIEIAAVILFSFIFDLAGKAITLIYILKIIAEIFLSIIFVILIGKYVIVKILEKYDLVSRASEGIIALVIAFMLILGFIGQVAGFNSAIDALFLGIILRKYINDRPVVAKQVSTITHGFFEPLFFIGLGLYFVKIDLTMLLYSILLIAIAITIKPFSGLIFSKIENVSKWKNSFGISVNGGVDAALLAVAFTAVVPLVTNFDYSFIMISIMVITLVIPLLFSVKAPVKVRPKSEYLWNIVIDQFKNLKACEITKNLQSIAVNINTPVSVAFKMCMDLNARAVIVIDNKNRVMGQVLLSDLILLGEDGIRKLKIDDITIVPATKVYCDSPATSLINKFREEDPQIIAVLDSKRKFLGTILEREILRHVSEYIDK